MFISNLWVCRHVYYGACARSLVHTCCALCVNLVIFSSSIIVVASIKQHRNAAARNFDAKVVNFHNDLHSRQAAVLTELLLNVDPRR